MFSSLVCFAEIECSEKLARIENGNFTCSDGNKFGSECLFVCNPGFEMVGLKGKHFNSAALTCTANRTWDGWLPNCTRKQCSAHDGALEKVIVVGKNLHYY